MGVFLVQSENMHNPTTGRSYLPLSLIQTITESTVNHQLTLVPSTHVEKRYPWFNHTHVYIGFDSKFLHLFIIISAKSFYYFCVLILSWSYCLILILIFCRQLYVFSLVVYWWHHSFVLFQHRVWLREATSTKGWTQTNGTHIYEFRLCSTALVLLFDLAGTWHGR